ncbi:hypothetical protein TWF506_009903 [Arthrobotrys conoides]|uniref:Phospholipase D n=1 Tax=Arthrobotrys conoides TaxID=74498 RepID=A0AAN8RLM8_9PEZI
MLFKPRVTISLAVYAAAQIFSSCGLVHASVSENTSQQVLKQHDQEIFKDNNNNVENGPASSVETMSRGRPFYAIAHHVLDRAGVDAALKHGANAIEIDFMAWKQGAGPPNWWADHDGHEFSTGDKAEVILEHIATKRRQGGNVVFVWFDIKNANLCDPNDQTWYKCSVHHLQDLARKYLIPSGVRVLYGTNSDNDIKAGSLAKLISRGPLHPFEAIDIDGDYENVAAMFRKYGSSLSTTQRVMSKGLFNWRLDRAPILLEIKKATFSNLFGRSFAWTSINDSNDEDMMRQLIDDSRADGLIYGGILEYQDGPLSKAPIERLKRVVSTLNVHFAQAGDAKPW